MFRALADPTRRSLLDELFREDGQTLSTLEARFGITRFGVMKHLKVLEEAGLVVTKRRGREKLHFLNAVPIRLIYDRWVSKYAEPWAADLSELKTRLETSMEKVYEIYIRTTPARLWQAITDHDERRKFQFGMTITSDWKVGSTVVMEHAGAAGLLVRRRDPRDRSAPPPRHVLSRPVERRRQGSRHVTCHLGDQPGRRFVLPAPDARRIAGGREQPDLRRLADDPFRTQDLARERRSPDHPRLARCTPPRPVRHRIGCIQVQLLNPYAPDSWSRSRRRRE